MNINDLLKRMPNNFSQTLRDLADVIDLMNEQQNTVKAETDLEKAILLHVKPSSKLTGDLYSVGELRVMLVRNGFPDRGPKEFSQALQRLGFVKTSGPEYDRESKKIKRGYWVEIL